MAFKAVTCTPECEQRHQDRWRSFPLLCTHTRPELQVLGPLTRLCQQSQGSLKDILEMLSAQAATQVAGSQATDTNWWKAAELCRASMRMKCPTRNAVVDRIVAPLEGIICSNRPDSFLLQGAV